MPALDQFVSQINAKALTRSSARAGKIINLHKIKYAAQASLILKKVQLSLLKRIGKLTQPVEIVVGKGDNKQIARVHDDKALCDAARTLCHLIEQQRIVLRIPSPGRDTPSEARTIEMPAAAAIDVQEIERMAKDAERVVNESEQSASNSGSVSPTDSLPSS